MWKTKINIRTSALPAIAAALALSSTTAFAQQAQPVPSDPPPATTATDQAAPAPLSDSAPPAPDTSVAAPDAAASSAPVADTKTASTTVRKTTKRATRTASVVPAVKSAPTHVTHVTTARMSSQNVASTPRTVAPAKPTATTIAQTTTAQTSQSAVQPVVDMNRASAPAGTGTTRAAKKHDDTLPIAGGALAFLAIGGAAVAMTRRRHDDEEEWVDDQVTERDPVDAAVDQQPAEGAIHEEEPAMIAPAASAFSWDNERMPNAAQAREPVSDVDDRLPGESWVQRAYRGPTPNNPSVSLRARLKRAAFFDKRERDVAAGKAEPVEMDAGLPEALVEDRQERELA